MEDADRKGGWLWMLGLRRRQCGGGWESDRGEEMHECGGDAGYHDNKAVARVKDVGREGGWSRVVTLSSVDVDGRWVHVECGLGGWASLQCGWHTDVVG